MRNNQPHFDSNLPNQLNEVSRMKSIAITSHKSSEGQLDWRIEEISVREDLKDDEVLVEMIAVGLCHTDILLSQTQQQDVRVLGHEGSGYVRKIGSKVTNCEIGDPVLLSFTFCGSCSSCDAKHPAYCEKFNSLNLLECEHEGETFTADSGAKITGKFFGQSSFSKFSVVNYRLMVNVKKFNLTREQLIKLAPLGCGFQTGAGGILNSGCAQPGDSAVVYGLGGVGMAAIMAAKVAGCNPVIGVDLLESKIEKAKKVGATHGIRGGNPEEIRKQLLEITGTGPDLSFECIGGSKFVENAVENAGVRGRIVYVGVGLFADVLQIPSFPFMAAGKQLIGSVEGDAIPSDFVPKMIEWYLEGKFPVEEVETVYPIREFQTALQDLKSGKTIKPILEF